MWSRLVSLNVKKVNEDILSLPMSCMIRPPIDTPDGRRSREVRFPAEYHVRVHMGSMERAPYGDHLPYVGMIDPAVCTVVDQVDVQKLRSGSYTIWILGGSHCREARSCLMVKHPQVDFYKRYVCYVYVGLTVEESLLVIPILTEVKSGVLSLDEMNPKFTLLKVRQRIATAFVEGVGADSWEVAKEEFPVHTREAMLSQYYKLYERNVKETPLAMQLYIAKALNYRDRLQHSQQEEQTAATHDPKGLLTNWTAFEGEGYKGAVKVAYCNMLQLPEKMEDIMDFPCGYNTEGSVDDEERFSKPQIEGSIESFKKITCASYWVIAGFCSSDMLTDVQSAFSTVCNCGVEVGIWVAPNISTSAGLKLTNCWQHCVLGFHSQSGSREPFQFQFSDSDTRMTCWSH
ncbi:hypothetical protein CBR_g20334 [Chara braunii]|uniref:Uncharacterized protein n=1 Tax=Chara braunii TaxID=69332 RepID=A0A388L075_CHABU|nr:hypothetical protein CBR_g20334 [Chara braunii]|eukprot:GBG75710.1 hypothetical protein CBR_g20334 [Chara braunii]